MLTVQTAALNQAPSPHVRINNKMEFKGWRQPWFEPHFRAVLSTDFHTGPKESQIKQAPILPGLLFSVENEPKFWQHLH